MWQAILRHNLQSELPLDVARVGDLPELPLSTNDLVIFAWAEMASRLLLAEDRHTMADHLQVHLRRGHHCPGILIPRSGVPMRELIECRELIARVGQPAEFADAINYIP